jgi:hypothetical protein
MSTQEQASMVYHLLTVLELTREQTDLRALHDRASLKLKKLAQDPKLKSRPTLFPRGRPSLDNAREHRRGDEHCFFRFAGHLRHHDRRP